MAIVTLLTTLVLLINASRAEVQVPPLREDPVLQSRAQLRAETLCASRQFSHDGYQAAVQGLGYMTIGENLARGHRDPRSVHAQFMASPGHRTNILRREFSAVGIGSACDITVELFGGRKAAARSAEHGIVVGPAILLVAEDDHEELAE